MIFLQTWRREPDVAAAAVGGHISASLPFANSVSLFASYEIVVWGLHSNRSQEGAMERGKETRVNKGISFRHLHISGQSQSIFPNQLHLSFPFFDISEVIDDVEGFKRATDVDDHIYSLNPTIQLPQPNCFSLLYIISTLERADFSSLHSCFTLYRSMEIHPPLPRYFANSPKCNLAS